MPESLILQFQKVDELLKGARRVLITSHENPDPDATASVLALHHDFKRRGLESLPYFPDCPPKNLSFLPGFFEIKDELNSFSPDVLFCLDYGDFKRLRLPGDVLANPQLCGNIVTIDHHLGGDQRGKIKIISPKLSSTSEIIYYWFKYRAAEISKEIATCLLTGIVSDSGGFRHVSTSSKTFNIVSELLLKGVPLSKIARQASILNKPLSLSKAWGQVLFRTKIDKKTGLAYSWICFEDLKKGGAGLVDFAGITNLISAGSQVNLGLFMVEYEKGKVKCSLRSEPHKGKSVVGIAEALGGGGHPYAAGFQQNGTIEEVLKKVINLIE